MVSQYYKVPAKQQLALAVIANYKRQTNQTDDENIFDHAIAAFVNLNNFGLNRRQRVSASWLYSSIMVSQYSGFLLNTYSL